RVRGRRGPRMPAGRGPSRRGPAAGGSRHSESTLSSQTHLRAGERTGLGANAAEKDDGRARISDGSAETSDGWARISDGSAETSDGWALGAGRHDGVGGRIVRVVAQGDMK